MTAGAAPADRGRHAATPWAIPAKGWKEVLLRTWKEAGEDNAGLIAAGIAFYGFLSIVPLLGALVLTYGLVASPATVVANFRALTEVMPADAAKLIGEALLNVVTTSGGKKGWGLLIALALALYGAMKGAGSVITGLNVAYDEKETRGFVRLNLVTLAITVVAVLIGLLAIVSVAAMGHLETVFPHAPTALLVLGKIGSYALMALVGAGAAASLYRYGPDRANAKWTWLTPGSALAMLGWLAVTLGFGFYVAHFGSYDATYGSLGAVVVLLTWLYLSAYILMVGGELNAELEHQTAEDSTTGPARPMGARRAQVADTVAGEDAVDAGDIHEPASGVVARPSPRPRRAIGLAGAVAARASGFGTVGLIPTLLATGGLAALRRPETVKRGATLLALGGLLAWRQGTSRR